VIVFGLRSLASEQDAGRREIAAITKLGCTRRHLSARRASMTSAFNGDLQQRQLEYKHHGDALAARQQRFSKYSDRGLRALEASRDNQWGLRPRLVKGTGTSRALRLRDRTIGPINNVRTQFHPTTMPPYSIMRTVARSAAARRHHRSRSAAPFTGR